MLVIVGLVFSTICYTTEGLYKIGNVSMLYLNTDAADVSEFVQFWSNNIDNTEFAYKHCLAPKYFINE